MPGIASLRRNALEVAFVAFVGVNLVAMELWPRWETIPFHLIWTSLTLLYGIRVWRLTRTFAVLIWFGLISGVLILSDAMNGTQQWGELFEVPLMSAMFLAMVWHARRRQDAIRATARKGEEKAALLDQQEQFLHDVSHELRTPVTIARGHLELLQRDNGTSGSEISVALDELERVERIVEGLLMLAKVGQPTFVDSVTELDLGDFLEDLVMRWVEVAPRAWRVGSLAQGMLRADPDALRVALDALVENAVKHTDPADVIELRSRAIDGQVAIGVADEGCGVPPELQGEIFERFARAEPARSGADGGLGLGLAIVDGIAKAHGGHCSLKASPAGSVFTLVLPGFETTDHLHALAGQARHAVPSPPGPLRDGPAAESTGG
jgi:signal transduction histidine kinase